MWPQQPQQPQAYLEAAQSSPVSGAWGTLVGLDQARVRCLARWQVSLDTVYGNTFSIMELGKRVLCFHPMVKETLGR